MSEAFFLALGIVIGVAGTILLALFLAARDKPKQDNPAAFSYSGVSMGPTRQAEAPQGITMQTYNEKLIQDALRIYEGHD